MSTLQISQSLFDTTHHDLNRRLQYFLRTSRGRSIATERLKNDLRVDQATTLKAINFAARIAFAANFSRLLEISLAHENVTEVFFVTINAREHAVPSQEAVGFNIEHCKAATRKFLKGASFVGIVEAGYYYYAGFSIAPHQPFVSWHSHAIVWAMKRSELAERKRQFNQTHLAFVPGRPAVHYRRISPDTALAYARYMSKSFLKEYTAYPKMLTGSEIGTGEISKRPTGKWRNRKRNIRPTNLVRALTAMGARTLRQLTFGGGTGKVLRRRVLKATRESLQIDATSRAANRRRLLSGP